MTALSARLDPCLNWFKLLARTKGRVLWIFPIVLLGAYIGVLSRSYTLGDFGSRRAERLANAPLLAEARRLNLDYEQVLAKPQAYVGKPVVWCVSMPAEGVSYVNGRPSWPVSISGPAASDGSAERYWTNSGSAGYCWNILSVIAGYERGRIQLRSIEKL